MKTEHVILGVTGIALIGITYMYIKSRQAGQSTVLDQRLQSATASANQGTMPVLNTGLNTGIPSSPVVTTQPVATPMAISPISTKLYPASSPILVSEPAPTPLSPVSTKLYTPTRITQPVYTDSYESGRTYYSGDRLAGLHFKPFTGLAGRIARA